MKSPAPSSLNSRNTMRANRRVSELERRLRRALWAAGARGYRVNSNLPGRPDLVFPKERVAVFVHGCFWHRCPTCQPKPPKANAAFWAAKFAGNVSRDREAAEQLGELDWAVVIVWEHSVRADPGAVADSLMEVRRARRRLDA